MKEDALSPVVGFILIIQILIIFLTLVQTVFIPDHLKKIEADNVEKLRGEVEKFSALASSGERAYMLVTLPDYPEYLFLLTPEPAGSSIYAEEFNITLKYTEVLPNGTKVDVLKNLKSSRIYVRVENYYYPDVTFIFENGAIFQKQDKAIVAVGDQALINSEIKLTILKGNLSLAYNTPKEIAFQLVSTGGFVYGENISITFESVNPDFWRKYGSVSGNIVTINASSGVIRINVYAFEGESVSRKPYRLLKLNPFDEYTVAKGDVKEFGVILLDRFNNPVVGETVNVSVTGGIGTVDGLPSISKVTDSAGRVYVSFKATSSGEGTVTFEVGNLSASYSIKVVAPQVSGASLINVEWLNKANLESPWDAYLEGRRVLSVKVYDQDLQPIPDIDVKFVVTNSSVVELNATVARTNSSGIASVEAYPLANGTTKVYAFAGDAGDVLNLTIINVTRPPWVYPGWKYRVPIYVEELSGNDLIDYQILVTLDASFNWSHAKSDGSDIRFADKNGNPIPYWIESWNYGSSAKIWVKLNITANENKTIYMYYGNASATSESDGDNVFDFFDDFTTTNLNTSKWTVVDQIPSIQHSILILTGGDSIDAIKTLKSFSPPIAIHYYLAPSETSGDWDTGIGFGKSRNNMLRFTDDTISSWRNYLTIHYKGWWSDTIEIQTPRSDYTTFHEYQVIVTNSGSIFKDLTDERGNPSQYSLNNGNIWLVSDNDNSGNQGLFDWIFVRKYVNPEPKVTIGQEEKY
ncbi:Protein of unknown function DUF2341 [Ferroglobus placidus DSM 10642]|uniref:DUF2341 domain-containing protein n=1 Tax=Ferroglobus placidus (strain DSM 10642 / AEDII12DO) TaxID=589924 RepID=D3RYL3_FERPA|nr:DUF2341 domain-containing protein [Ferroglobus placidus]ADC65576.1 Protein of unknown function DUF2341 [Ferroglobus placidus DSM 10642]